MVFSAMLAQLCESVPDSCFVQAKRKFVGPARGYLMGARKLPKSSKFDHFRRGCGGSDNVPKKWCRGARVRLHMHVRSLVVGDSRSAEGCLYVCVPDLLHCSADVCACVYTQVVLRSVCFRFFARVHARVFQVCFPPTCSAVIET